MSRLAVFTPTDPVWNLSALWFRIEPARLAELMQSQTAPAESDTEHFARLLHLLKVNQCQTQTLDLSATLLDERSVEFLKESLCSNTHLKSLVLRGVVGNTSPPGLTSEGFRCLLSVLPINQSLQYLDISANKMDTKTCQQLSSALEHNTHLVELRMSHCGAKDEALAALYPFLKTNRCLKTLDVSYNEGGQKSFHALARALLENLELSELRLSHNDAQADAQLEWLCFAIVGHPSLSKVYLDGVRLTHKALKVLAHGLGDSALTELDLKNVRLDESCAIALAIALEKNVSLKVLDLSNTMLQDRGVLSLALGLAANQTLAEFHVSLNDLGVRGAAAVSALIAPNVALRHHYPFSPEIDRLKYRKTLIREGGGSDLRELLWGCVLEAYVETGDKDVEDYIRGVQWGHSIPFQMRNKLFVTISSPFEHAPFEVPTGRAKPEQTKLRTYKGVIYVSTNLLDWRTLQRSNPKASRPIAHLFRTRKSGTPPFTFPEQMVAPADYLTPFCQRNNIALDLTRTVNALQTVIDFVVRVDLPWSDTHGRIVEATLELVGVSLPANAGPLQVVRIRKYDNERHVIAHCQVDVTESPKAEEVRAWVQQNSTAFQFAKKCVGESTVTRHLLVAENPFKHAPEVSVRCCSPLEISHRVEQAISSLPAECVGDGSAIHILVVPSNVSFGIANALKRSDRCVLSALCFMYDNMRETWSILEQNELPDVMKSVEQKLAEDGQLKPNDPRHKQQFQQQEKLRYEGLEGAKIVLGPWNILLGPKLTAPDVPKADDLLIRPRPPTATLLNVVNDTLGRMGGLSENTSVDELIWLIRDSQYFRPDIGEQAIAENTDIRAILLQALQKLRELRVPKPEIVAVAPESAEKMGRKEQLRKIRADLSSSFNLEFGVPSIKSLDLFATRIPSAGYAHVIHALTCNESVERLNISGNRPLQNSEANFLGIAISRYNRCLSQLEAKDIVTERERVILQILAECCTANSRLPRNPYDREDGMFAEWEQAIQSRLKAEESQLLQDIEAGNESDSDEDTITINGALATIPAHLHQQFLSQYDKRLEQLEAKIVDSEREIEELIRQLPITERATQTAVLKRKVRSGTKGLSTWLSAIMSPPVVSALEPRRKRMRALCKRLAEIHSQHSRIASKLEVLSPETVKAAADLKAEIDVLTRQKFELSTKLGAKNTFDKLYDKATRYFSSVAELQERRDALKQEVSMLQAIVEQRTTQNEHHHPDTETGGPQHQSVESKALS